MSPAVLGAAAFLMLNSFLVDSALAGPPMGRQTFRAPSQPQASPQALPPHLDLRPPSHLELGSHLDLAANAAERGHPFATPMFATPMPRAASSAQEPVPLSAMASDGMRSRPAIQDFVRRVHREGLPVARLFESKTALVHVGLSPKGKPGLWLVQKIH